MTRGRLLVILLALAAAGVWAWVLYGPVGLTTGAATVAGRIFGPGKGPDRLPLERLNPPPGYAVTVYARIVGARSLALGDQGTVFVGTRGDAVYALRDADSDHRAEQIFEVASGLDMPNGVAFRQGALYVAEISRILRYPGIEARLDDPPPPEIVLDSLPSERHHGWKYIAFGPDGSLYIPVGAPCNVCLEDDPRFASILRLPPGADQPEIFASGVRNSVGLDFHPQTGSLWFTNNGRDWLGDDSPPDTLHAAPRPGLDFGFPHCHAGEVPDPEFGDLRPCSDFDPPALKIQAHSAPLGLAFVRGPMFEPDFSGRVIMAEHGSWNRSSPVGYRLSSARTNWDKASDYQVFMDGWLSGGKAWGRPVDVLFMPDGAMLISDDHGGAIYRLARSGG